jgi:hypothetical protein
VCGYSKIYVPENVREAGNGFWIQSTRRSFSERSSFLDKELPPDWVGSARGNQGAVGCFDFFCLAA